MTHLVLDRYHRLIFSIAVRILKNEIEAEDVVQNVFLNIYHNSVGTCALSNSLHSPVNDILSPCWPTLNICIAISPSRLLNTLLARALLVLLVDSKCCSPFQL